MKLSLEDIYTKGTYWKDKQVKQVIDENFYQFRAHYQKYPYLYNEDVKDYVTYINDKITGYLKNKPKYKHYV